MKKTLLVMLTVLVLFFTSSVAMAQPRYHGGHHGGGNGAGTAIVALVIFAGIAIVAAVVNEIFRTKAYAQQAAPAVKPDHLHIGECFPEGKYFPDNIGVFNEYGQEVGYISAETTFRPGTCLE